MEVDMNQLQSLTERVRKADANKIDLPVLRDLVRDIQTKSPDEIRRDAQHWSDDKFSQWKQHSSHNPW